MARLKPPRRRAHGHGSVSLVDRGAKPYVANYRDAQSGKARRKAFATDDEAQVFLDAWYAEKRAAKLAARQGREVAQTPIPRAKPAERTFGELIALWRTSKEGTIRASTWRNYDPALGSLRKYLGPRKADELRPEHFERYREARVNGLDWVERRRVKPLAPATINQHLDRAEQIFEWAIKRRLVAGPNPVSDVDSLKREQFEPVVIEEAAIAELIAAAADKHRLAFALIGHLALRWGEAVGIGEEHIDAASGLVLVRQQIEEDRQDGYRVKVAPYVKSKRSRRDLLASDLILEEATAARARIAGARNPHRLLMPSGAGTPRRYRNWLRDAWLPALKRAGLEKSGLTPHGVRHSRLSLMARSGNVTPGDLSRFAGHRSVAFTLSRYGDHFSTSTISPDKYLTAA
jgi:integrase